MLFKKELEEIPVAPMPELDGRYVASAQIVELKKSGRVLAVDFYRYDKQFCCRFFSDGKNFTTCTEWPAQSWKEAHPRSYTDDHVEAAPEDVMLVFDFLKSNRYSKGSLMRCIEGFVYDIRSERSEKARNSKEELREKHFAMYPALPEGLRGYCERKMFDAYIFIGKLVKGKRSGICSFCSEEVEVDRGARSGQKGICPKCGKHATYRAIWIKDGIENKGRVCVAHKVDDQLLLRWTNVKRRFSPGEYVAKYEFEDYAYNLHLNVGKQRKTYFYKYTTAPYYYGCWTWFRGHLGDYCWDETYVYSDNLHEVFGERYYNVDLKAGMERCRGQVAFAVLLNSLKSIPHAEYLFKLGMIQLAAKASHFKPGRGKKPGFAELLGVDASMKQIYIQMDVDLSEHRLIKDYGKYVSAEQIEAYRQLKIQDWENDKVKALLRNMSFAKFLHYFEKQKRLNPKYSTSKLITWYRDYLDMSAGLGVDMSHKSVRFPKNCVEAHDQILARFNERKMEAENMAFSEAVKPLYERLAVTEYAKSGFCIVLPQKRSDLTTEGQSLNHCVGGDSYYKNHIAGTYMIFFVRKSTAPDKPFFTMEVGMSDFKIKQLYGFGDCSAPKDVRAFAESFVKKLASGSKLRKVS